MVEFILILFLRFFSGWFMNIYRIYFYLGFICSRVDIEIKLLIYSIYEYFLKIEKWK